MQSVAKFLKSYPALQIIAVLLVGFSLLSPYFLTSGNFEAMLGANAVVLIAAIGMTVVFLAGGIDLSISTVISASAVIAGIVMAETDNVALGAVTAVIVGLGFGALNGVLIGYFRLTPFITTMATQLIARGIAFVLSQGIAVKGTPFWMLDFGFMAWMGIPAVTLVALALVALSVLLMSQTTWGRHVMLVGSNAEAARHAGINTRFIDFSVYLFAGALAGAAGFISIANLGNAIPGVGDTLLLIIIGAVVLGGTGMNGGEGSVERTLLGVGILAILTNGLNLVGIPFYDQLIIQGVLIFLGTWLAMRLGSSRSAT
ncbi:ABC transporter permease [Cognatishimia maritima]|uniref:Ribose transport system permease protein n=1 Tax=Cognatishimia maritima TaxID=870908 RepID=A0A1M5QHB4_9RHOB|nr:ABC transporter permease [Cognatishimia maritima]SHH13266.1 ribose transport system permease protein [Cognatishimia maritima]